MGPLSASQTFRGEKTPKQNQKKKTCCWVFFAIRANALAFFTTRQKYFRPLLQRGLRAILELLLCPETPLLSSPPAGRPAGSTSHDHNRQTPPTPSLQGNKHKIIYSSPFPLVLSVFISFFPLCSNPPSTPPHPTSQSLPSVFAPHPPSQLFLCRLCRYRARVEKVESPAKVHVFYIDYGNVSTLWLFSRTTTQLGAVVLQGFKYSAPDISIIV